MNRKALKNQSLVTSSATPMTWPAGMNAAQLIELLKTVPASTLIYVETETPHKPAQRMFTKADKIAGLPKNAVLISFAP